MRNFRLTPRNEAAAWGLATGLFGLWWYCEPYPALGAAIAIISGLGVFGVLASGRIERFRRPFFTAIMLAGALSLAGTFMLLGPVQFAQWLARWDPGYFFASSAGQGTLLYPSPVVMGSVLWGGARFLELVGMWQSSVPGSMAGALLFMLPYAVILLVFGRAFCGWLCPIGGLVDLAASTDRDRLALDGLREKIITADGFYYGRLKRWVGWIRYILLLVVVALSLWLGFALVNLFYPVLWLKSTPALWVIAGVLLVFAIALPLVTGRRWWCYICPVGAVVSLVDRFGPFKLKIDKERCTGCMDCASSCRMFALTPAEVETGRIRSSLCSRCGRCIEACSEGAIDIFWAETKKKARAPFIATATATALAFNVWYIVLLVWLAGRTASFAWPG